MFPRPKLNLYGMSLILLQGVLPKFASIKFQLKTVCLYDICHILSVFNGHILFEFLYYTDQTLYEYQIHLEIIVNVKQRATFLLPLLSLHNF